MPPFAQLRKPQSAQHALKWGFNGPVRESDATDGGRLLATALYAYLPDERRASSHLQLAPGETVEVLRHHDSGADRLGGPWAFGRLRGQTGWFPASYVRRVPPANERSARTEKLLEALALVLLASREQQAPLPGQLLDVERVRALLGLGTSHGGVSEAGVDGRAADGAEAGMQGCPLSASVLGLPTADVLLAASMRSSGSAGGEVVGR